MQMKKFFNQKDLLKLDESIVDNLIETLEAIEDSDSKKDHEDDNIKEELPTEICLLPLRDSLIYPTLIAPLSVARESSVQLITENITNENKLIGVIAQKDPYKDTPSFDNIYQVGCIANVRTTVKMPDATRLIVQGISRFKIIEPIQEKPYLRAKVEFLSDPDVPESKLEQIEAFKRTIIALFEQAIKLSPNLPEELRGLAINVEEAGVMADLIAAHLSVGVQQKQNILETLDVGKRLRLLLEMLSREVRILELSSKVSNEVNAEISKSQREYYLREQLKAIQKELGEVDDRSEEISEIKEKLDKLEKILPKDAKKEASREFSRLKRISPSSPEYSVARTYLDWIISMPWNKFTEDNLDLNHVLEVLNDEHYGLEKVKERITEFLAVRIVKKEGEVRQPILCLVGPPGVGKTSLGQSIANAMGRKFGRVSLGGMRDEAEIRGHRRTYVGAMPGQIIQNIRRLESNNPVIVLDELDKLGNDFRGDPSSALLEVLDPQQNKNFRDHYMDVPFDLSKVFFIATANRLDTIPSALRDRMEVIELSGYTQEEKLQISLTHLVPKQIKEHGLTDKQIAFEESALKKLIRFYTREAGVRNLDREIATVTRKSVKLFAIGRKAKVKVNEKFLLEKLGSPRYTSSLLDERSLKAGMAVGLAWTPVGGDVLFIEASASKGNKSLLVTGQLGDVMKESVHAALSYIKSNTRSFKISESMFDKKDIHIHVPEGAVPKDGPSAGVTMLTAILSLLKNKAPKPYVAMTGEITLKGEVLPVGGIKEKVLAAYRAGAKTVILPFQNKKDYIEDVPKDISEKLKVVYAKNGKDVIKHALDV